MKPDEYYQKQIDHYTARLKQIKKRRNLITLAKLLTFGYMIFLIYLLINHSTQPLLLLGIGAILVFIFLTLWDSQIIYRQHLIEELLRINTLESDYLAGNFSALDQGERFNDPAHPYAHDLDLFGEDSLFQHLNRTVTFSGTQKLVSWLLSLSKDPEVIHSRQQAAEELCAEPEWCQHFRAAGALHPTQALDAVILKSGPTESPFFSKHSTVRLILWIANTIVIVSWAVTSFTPLPFSISLVLSLLQLSALALYIKKINAYHQRLNLFLKTISNYLPLVRLIHDQSFRSPYLQKIRHSLFTPESNSLQALTQLHRIQNSLDQRGNIVIAFILNGLYLKDFHTLLRLDHWRKKYGPDIETWTDVLSEADALISMANYRFNHPAYCLPVICQDRLLDTEEIGHPLLKSERNVTNDFSIRSLHQIAIVTGANMAGKSTFLRTIGVNLILAQSGNVVCSRYFAFQPMTLFTSMRTTDSLSKDTSYFHAELLRLQQLVNIAQQEDKVFIILDEMLKGTNSVDKLNGSLAFLKRILSYPISGLVATHDLALVELADDLPEHFFNVCFEIVHSGSQITYDYKLHTGISS
ncbi:MAG: DNA mismatch repair protein MutS, partial [Odoribacter sp.]|nr:DNA mismatch repair protein MutS [Odoribacter sp.]